MVVVIFHTKCNRPEIILVRLVNTFVMGILTTQNMSGTSEFVRRILIGQSSFLEMHKAQFLAV